jgi:hypothetical protein
LDVDDATGAFYTAREIDEALRERRDADLRSALDRVRNYLTEVVVAGAQQGSERGDAVYVKVADTVVRHASRSGRPSKTLLTQLRERIADLAFRSDDFGTYGLITGSAANQLTETLERAEPRHAWLLTQVLSPYLDGLAERMDALDRDSPQRASTSRQLTHSSKGSTSISAHRGASRSQTTTLEKVLIPSICRQGAPESFFSQQHRRATWENQAVLN